jgi:hypothetical protein
MKKLIIALSAMAIASFSFVTPVSAEFDTHPLNQRL